MAAVAETPWTNAQKTLDVRAYYDHQAARMWKFVSIGQWALMLVLLVVLGLQISRQTFSMHVVAVDGTGREVGNWPAGDSLKITDAQKRARLEDWIIEARSVSPDPIVTKRYVDRLFSTVGTGSSADTFLKEYYAGGMSPFTRAQTCTVDPRPESVVALSADTYQVQWTETTRDISGAVQSVEHWTAAITLAVSPAKSSLTVPKLNGLGLYIVHLSWAKVSV